jgi:AraC family transcriptional regulator
VPIECRPDDSRHSSEPGIGSLQRSHPGATALDPSAAPGVSPRRREQEETKPMSEARFPVVAQSIAHGASADASARSATCRSLGAILGRGRGCQLRTDSAVCAIWIPLRGRVQIGNGSDSLLQAGEARVTEADADARMQAIGRGNSLWVALLGRPAAWRQVMQGQLGIAPMHAWLFPARHAADLDLKRRAVALARAIATGDGVEIAAENVVERVVAMQAGFAEAIARCPGRTYTQRRQVFVRLQRVRNYLTANCHLEIDNDELARMANYSPSHFIRAFGSVYEETPHAFLIRRRLERARRLLRISPLAINEIALESGFENASAFSRLFRQRFGITAGTARRRNDAVDAAAV